MSTLRGLACSASRARFRSGPFCSNSYGKTKAAEAAGHLPFDGAFGKTFATVFHQLDDKTALDSEYFLETPSGVFHQQLEQLLEQFKGSQSLAFAAAVSLTQTYLAAKAQQSIAPYLSGAEARDDEHRYTIDNEVLIKTFRRRSNTIGHRGTQERDA